MVCLGPVSIVWVLAFVWDRFHSMSLGDYGGAFIETGDSEARKGLAEKKQQESLVWPALVH